MIMTTERKDGFWKWVFPHYIWVPVIIAEVFNTIGYFGIAHLKGLKYHDLSLPLDHMIPAIPLFVIIYVLAYVQWFFGFLTCGRENRDYCYKWMSAEFYAKFLTFVIYLVLPTTILRPEITGSDFASILLRGIYRIDGPVNLFPSVHCLESWFCFRSALKQKKTPEFYKWISFCATILVFLSVLFTRQHVIADIFGAILVFELGMLFARKVSMAHIYLKIEDKLSSIFTGRREMDIGKNA